MIEKECEIVKDLLPNYIESQVSNVTKDFIEDHIKECKNCKKTLNLILR